MLVCSIENVTSPICVCLVHTEGIEEHEKARLINRGVSQREDRRFRPLALRNHFAIIRPIADQ